VRGGNTLGRSVSAKRSSQEGRVEGRKTLGGSREKKCGGPSLHLKSGLNRRFPGEFEGKNAVTM